MNEKIIQVFYGTDLLPYKDQARSVHFPVAGTGFIGASNTTYVRFYVNEIGGVANITWVAIAKLPSGKKLYKVLGFSNDTTITPNEYYVYLNLSSEFMQENGDLFLSLNGYAGGVEITYDSESGLYSVEGNPVIQATGSIKISVGYTPYMAQNYNNVPTLSVQDALALVSGKLDKEFAIISVQSRAFENVENYDDGQIIYDKSTKGFFKVESGEFVIQNLYSLSYSLFKESDNEVYLRLNLLDNTGVASTQLIKLSTYLATLDQLATKVDKTDSANKLYATDNSGNQTTLSVDYGSTFSGNVVRRDSNSQIYVPLTPTANGQATSKKYVDDKIAEFKENEISVVDTTTYPTLNDFLGSTGEEGLIYLYPIDTTDLTKGYYRYVWENNTWLSLGTTEIDLSDYYTSTQVDNLLSAKADSDDVYTKTQVDDLLDDKQDTLVSGTNIKTINNTTLLGSGNYAFDSAFNELSTNALENQVVAKEFREINYEIAMIREALFEVVLSEIDYSVNYAMTYVVPDTLSDTDGTHRVVYSETQLVSVSGNSVVDNQLVNIDYKTASYSTSSTNYQIARLGFINTINTHRYLLNCKCTKSSNMGIRLRYPYISDFFDDGTNNILFVPDQSILTEIDFQIVSTDGEHATVTLDDIQLIDLTKMFPTDTPTTLDDTRIKWLLSRGYIAYNTGSLLSTSVSGLESKNVDELVQLPNEYQQVEYIESTGTQYINTNYVPNSNTKIVLDYQFLSVPPNNVGSYQVGCGGTDNTNRNRCNFGITPDNSIYLGNGSQQTLTSITSEQQIARHTVVWDMVSNKMLLDNTEYSGFQTFNAIGRNFYIFGRNQADGGNLFLHPAKFYSMKCYNSNTISNIFVPCYRKIDGVIGLYDTVNNVFYTNAGTGTFLKGNNAYYDDISFTNTELKSAGSVHDYLEIVEGNVVEGEQRYNLVKHTLVGSYTFTGQESWTHRTTSPNNDWWFSISNSVLSAKSQTINIINTLGLPSRDTTYGETEGISLIVSGSLTYLYIAHSGLNTTSDIVSFTQGQTLTYELATPTQETISTDLTFEQVSLLIQQGCTINSNFTNVPPNVTTTFVVKKAVGE